ncbi:MAG: hypothetical protein M3280_11575, partial [Actinomycetota bacterium]|nr:hypothetical protein [Actinomycetota bacterium]
MAAKNKAGEVESVLAALARGIVGEAYVVEIPGRMQQTLDQVAAAQDRKQILKALRLLNTRIGALALTGRPIPVSWLRPAEA